MIMDCNFVNPPIQLSLIILYYHTVEQVIPIVDELKRILTDLTDHRQLVLVGNYVTGNGDRTNEIVNDIARKD